MLNSGVADLFPQLNDECCTDGDNALQSVLTWRSRHFEGLPKTLTRTNAQMAGMIATMFGDSFFPVFTALICLETRSWHNARSDNSSCPYLLDQLTQIIEWRGLVERVETLDTENWLRPGQVNTCNFPGVRQWIVLLRAFVRRQKLTKSAGCMPLLA